MADPLVGDRIMLVLARADIPVVLARITGLGLRAVNTEFGWIPRDDEGVTWQRAEHLDPASADALKAARLLAWSARR